VGDGSARAARPADARQQTGRSGEQIATDLYRELGFEIVARNWRRPEGEIDLVARSGDLLVVVEVRSRHGDELGHPLETVTPRKQAQIIRSTRYYLAAETPRFRELRFDVVGIVFRPDAPPDVTRVEDAFRFDI